jgi:hypothetical protein
VSNRRKRCYRKGPYLESTGICDVGFEDMNTVYVSKPGRAAFASDKRKDSAILLGAKLSI